MKTGIELIAAERERQVTEAGWTPEHDATHEPSVLLAAARCYAFQAVLQLSEAADPTPYPPPNWPWRSEWWKPSRDPVRNLAKAGALIAAEIDRIQRAAKLREQFTEAQEGRDEHSMER